MKSDDILESFPDPTENMMNEISSLFKPYIFYQKRRNGEKECWCTSCNEHYTYGPEKTMNQEKLDFIYGKHNDLCVCRKCGRKSEFKSLGKSKSRNSLWEQIQIVSFIPDGYNKVYMRAYYATKSYKDSLTPNVSLSERARYLLEPGSSRVWLNRWSSGYYDFTECKNPIEPFTNQMYQAGGIYHIVNKFSIEETFLKYSQVRKFFDECGGYTIKYLQYYARHPQIEMFMKLGFIEFVKHMVLYNSPNKKIVNWNAKNLGDAFKKLTKQQIKELSSCSDYVNTLKTYNKLISMKNTVTITEANTIIEKFSYILEDILKIAKDKNQPVMKIYRYLLKCTPKNQQVTASGTTWRDYIYAADKLNYDFTDQQVLYPKKMKSAHDNAIKNVKYKEVEEANMGLKKRTEILIKRYSFENEEYFIKIPESTQEIIDEGQALSHCVGGYAVRHSEGTTTILFLRRKDEPDKSLYTIEVWDKTVHQIQGFKNKTPLTKSAKEFFEKWKLYISKKQKGTKNKQSAVSA